MGNEQAPIPAVVARLHGRILSGMKYLPSVLILGAAVIGALFWFLNREPALRTVPDGGIEVDSAVSTVAEGLSVPWAIAFLPDGALLVTERTGTLARIEDGEVTRLTVESVRTGGEGGLLGLALHPDFAENHFLYLYLTSETAGGTENRVVRYVYQGGALTDAVAIIEGIPGARYHDGGRIAFGPDGYLYVTTGDAGDETSAQDTASLSGKILRLKDDGSLPADNPFGNAVYSYGHRNPQGLAWDAAGELWATEHGRSGVLSGYDELNRIERGANYGWPEVQGDETREGMTPPVLHSGASDTWAPASLAYRDGVLYWGGLRGEALYEARIERESVADLRAHFAGEYGRIRELQFDANGRLYFTTSNTDGRGNPQAGDDRVISVDMQAL